ncbi:CMRF35-like molecule 3 [Malaclemys terrapin pileata]|uniref:CMRF35-like molecule 3 n=1 Tax=Malaclemys terrapin pileata TaxID=2991368 RepID=UPI0023A7FD48|nr:CMRF35-like molecule 3 [Malaclemys terrapin pileata]
MLFPGCWAVTGPGAVRGPPGGSVAVRCQYRTGYEDYHKFWCREGGSLVEGWFWCNGHIVETDGSEAEVTRGRVSIRDNHTQRVFTVTLDNLTRADAGTYHCGVCNQLLLPPQYLLPSGQLLRKGNPASPLTRTPLPLCCWAVTGPGAVRGPPGGSVAVRCRYRTGYEDYHKFWCREGGSLVEGWFWCNGHIVETDGSEAEVTRGRVSIRDNHTQRVFTVTLDNLTRADAGTYRCGVVRTGLLDLRAAVEVTVSPANSSPIPTKRSSSATVPPASSSPSKPTFIWTTTEKGKSSFSTNQDTTPSVAQDSHILLHILLPCVLLLLILFLLAAVMLSFQEHLCRGTRTSTCQIWGQKRFLMPL